MNTFESPAYEYGPVRVRAPYAGDPGRPRERERELYDAPETTEVGAGVAATGACAGAWSVGAGACATVVTDAVAVGGAELRAGVGCGTGRRLEAAATWWGLAGREIVAARACGLGFDVGVGGAATGVTRSAKRTGADRSRTAVRSRSATAAEPNPIPAAPAAIASMRPIEGVVLLAMAL